MFFFFFLMREVFYLNKSEIFYFDKFGYFIMKHQRYFIDNLTLLFNEEDENCVIFLNFKVIYLFYISFFDFLVG